MAVQRPAVPGETSNGLKPCFNDYVVNDGHAFGFDGSILACVDLADGKRRWKGGRYGTGQLVLLAEQDLLLVVLSGCPARVRARTSPWTSRPQGTPARALMPRHTVLLG